MTIALGTASPDRSICLEWMLHDTVLAMRSMDEVLANDVAQGFCQLLQAQTSQERSTIKTLGSYLKFREIDVGRPYVLSLLFIFGYNCRVLTAILDSTQLSLDSVPSSISLPPNSKSPPLWKAPHFAMSVL